MNRPTRHYNRWSMEEARFATTIAERVAVWKGLELSDMLHPCHRRDVLRARGIAAALVRKHTALPLTQIALELDMDSGAVRTAIALNEDLREAERATGLDRGTDA